ncbi:PH, RCC1 and FYVE domains-containing protein 1-like [Apium graveolens]|uniref:PH, RCC1 and FYVE domains-containing protein 1-like n=1 Tax=Apium graveolens TaxID=4045 RepID=UPI003D7C0C2E
MQLTVENYTRKVQFQELELERTTKQLKEAIATAGEETAKCQAAKDVIKSLTALLKDMAERLPVGASRNMKSTTLASFGVKIASSDVSNASNDLMNGHITNEDPDSNGSNGQILSNGSNHQFLLNGSNNNLFTNTSNSQLLLNGSNTVSSRLSGQNRMVHSEATIRNGSKTKESDSRNESEWVEQDEPGVYITLTSLSGGVKDLKQVRFSRKRFTGLVRNKLNNGGQRIGHECMRSTMCAWSTSQMLVLGVRTSPSSM